MDDYTIPITKPASQFAGNSSQQKQETTYPSEIVDLPSQGHFYPSSSPLSNGTINLKIMTAKEEDILTNQNYIKKGIVLDKLIESLIVDKDIKLDDLLLGDKNAVFVAIRRFAYGDSYGPLQIKCPSCRENNECTFNLIELKYKEIEIFDKPYKVKQLGKTFVLDPEVYVGRKGKPLNIKVQNRLINRLNHHMGGEGLPAASRWQFGDVIKAFWILKSIGSFDIRWDEIWCSNKKGLELHLD